MRIVDHVATMAAGAPGQRGGKYPKHYLCRHRGSLHRQLRCGLCHERLASVNGGRAAGVAQVSHDQFGAHAEPSVAVNPGNPATSGKASPIAAAGTS
jgi:hypothetical protein